jgi:hypothetical protein
VEQLHLGAHCEKKIDIIGAHGAYYSYGTYFDSKEGVHCVLVNSEGSREAA